MSGAKGRVVHRTAHFSSDAQLLAELGERLVATPHVALAELVKNAYDADSTKCYVWLDRAARHQVLNVRDFGHGMTEHEFLAHWMKIATTDKLERSVSRHLHRLLSGSKGVGRFAVRKLGNTLRLETVAETKGSKYERLVATFDWKAFESGLPIDEVGIPYEVVAGASPEDRGTLLQISGLAETWTDLELASLTAQLVDILELPGFEWLIRKARAKQDPGFRVYFCRPEEKQEPQASAGAEVLERAVGRVRIKVRGDKVTYNFEYQGLDDRAFAYSLAENQVGLVEGEVLYFPRRAGVFAHLSNVDGRNARSWLTNRGGVKVFDRGFRIPPYGEWYDDWLKLAASKTERERRWGSPFTDRLFSSNKFETEGAFAPVLKIPHNRQLYGAIAVESFRANEVAPGGLQPAMDRQGFLENEGFAQFRDIVRSAVEIFAVLDVEETKRTAQKAARQRATQLKKELSAAIQRIQADETIPKSAKKSIVKSYENVAGQVARLEEAQKEASRAIETMALLGVLSGFMTHETTVMLRAVEQMVALLRRIPKESRTDQFEEVLAATQDALTQLRNHLDYAEIFVRGAKASIARPFKVRPQVDLVLRQLKRFADDRGISIENEVAADLLSPRIPLSVFSGVLLNLYSNAIKAIMARGDWSENAKIRVDAERMGDQLILWIADSGIGVPDEVRDRIFEPLFSTTGETPLGIGMGLGLTIVRRLLRELGGAVDVVDPPTGFRTCFEVRLPYERS